MMQRLSIILATRGRPKLLQRTLEITRQNIKLPSTKIWVAVDDDDGITIDYFTNKKSEDILGSLSTRAIAGPREDSLGAKYNRILRLDPEADCYLVMVDYAPHVTPGFDEKILEAASIWPDGIGCVYNHLANLSFSGINAVTRKWVEKFGCIYPEYYPFWYIDHELDDYAKMLHRFAFADVRLDLSQRPGTQGKRDVRFWCQFMVETSQWRAEKAAQIIGSGDFFAPEWHKQQLLRNIQLHMEHSALINANVMAGSPLDEVPDNDRYRRLRQRAYELLPSLQVDGYYDKPMLREAAE